MTDARATVLGGNGEGRSADERLVSVTYTRPGWTGAPMHYSDGTENFEFSQCPSCLSHHGDSYLSCNGKREPSDQQCEAVLGEARCDRPDNHLGAHEAKSALLRVEWELLPNRGGGEGSVTE